MDKDRLKNIFGNICRNWLTPIEHKIKLTDVAQEHTNQVKQTVERETNASAITTEAENAGKKD